MQPFDPNDYRKRVLAAVERRGGLEHSDAFELYDVPLELAETLTDAEVAARVTEVWGFWQRQRDHPKYRVLVGLLVDNHERLSYLLLDGSARRAEALRIRREREERDAERFAMLDAAIARLVERHGGVPAGKVAGLEEIGAMGGLSAAEVAGRLRRHRVVADASAAGRPAPTRLTEERRGQIRRLLAEWARLVDGPPTPTLLALIGLDTTRAGDTEEIRLRADALRARARELPPGRMRVVLDELLVHVADLLEPGADAAEEYVVSVVSDVAERLRPKVRAAVLVEDELAGDDYEFLHEEAVELGLDSSGAVMVLEELARELGARVRPGMPPPHAPPGPAPAPVASPARARQEWMEPLKAARAALRAGRPQEAARHIADARMLDAHRDGTTQIRSVADDVERVLAEAAAWWRAAATARAATRYAEVLDLVDTLRRTASDVPPPTGYDVGLEALGAEAKRAVAEADRLVGAAAAASPVERARLLSQALACCADHESATRQLADTPVPTPTGVATRRLPNGSVLVTWSAPTAERADYRVTCLRPDGSWRVVGRTHATEIEDGGAPEGDIPVYAVATAIGGRYSEPARSDAVPRPAAARTEVASGPTTTARIDYTRPATRRARPAPADQDAPATASTPVPPQQTSSPARPVERAATSTATDGHAAPGWHGAAGGHGAAGERAAAGRDGAAGGRYAAGEHAAACGDKATGGYPATGGPSVTGAREATHGQATTGEHASADGHAAPAARANAGWDTGFASVPMQDGQRASGPGQTSSGDPGTAGPDVPADPMPGGIPVVARLAEHGGLLVFDWPAGITEVMVVVRADRPPLTHDEPGVRAWKVTNMRYQIDGGVTIPAELPRPCHVAVASCRREPDGRLLVAPGVAPSARMHWSHTA
ncbi:hypothetical protein [Nocardia higoensis]|uniref:hypothetical protein n=1 Tax=Nocardia higoensis TaxID=228599 RepID=UPI0002E1A1FC|nr:hypothetical protein [Nocardia higoensis]